MLSHFAPSTLCARSVPGHTHVRGKMLAPYITCVPSFLPAMRFEEAGNASSCHRRILLMPNPPVPPIGAEIEMSSCIVHDLRPPPPPRGQGSSLYMVANACIQSAECTARFACSVHTSESDLHEIVALPGDRSLHVPHSSVLSFRLETTAVDSRSFAVEPFAPCMVPPVPKASSTGPPAAGCHVDILYWLHGRPEHRGRPVLHIPYVIGHRCRSR